MQHHDPSQLTNNTPPANKLKPVTIIIDNRDHYQHEDSSTLKNFRNSAFKQTEVDPLEFNKNEEHFIDHFDIIHELNQRVASLESRVKSLAAQDFFHEEGGQSVKEKKKNRRKFAQLPRNHKCLSCQKIYGSETALKNHLKIKHQRLDALKELSCSVLLSQSADDWDECEQKALE